MVFSLFFCNFDLSSAITHFALSKFLDFIYTQQNVSRFTLTNLCFRVTIHINKRRRMCKCGNKSINGQRKCKVCHRQYMREWRKSHPLTREQRIKDICRSYLNVYVKRGKIVRGICKVCGAKKVQAHHNDYTKPLYVEWFCKKHHQKFHNLANIPQ